MNEYGIACLIKSNTSEKLHSHIPFLDKENIPHVSLFQFKCYDINFINIFNQFVKNIYVSATYKTEKISIVEDNVFLDIKDDSSLKCASQLIADFYSENCKEIHPLSQINLSTLTSLQKSLVEKYGIYWIKQNFQPHVTLAYESNLTGNFNFILPQHVELDSPAIYSIDAIGRIIQDEPQTVCNF